jgi:perosamine synthetase
MVGNPGRSRTHCGFGKKRLISKHNFMKLISLFGVVNLPEMEAAAVEVLRSGRIASGEYVAKFESAFGTIVGQQNVVSTIDMTSAMLLALHLSDVTPGDEVLTTAFTCMSSSSAIAQSGATPVWVDVQPNSVEIDISDLASKITTKTRAVVLYHAVGYPGPAAEVAKLCQQHNIALIEDCNNALLATRDGSHVGSHGDFAVYSFYPNRQVNTTEGGALVCKNSSAASRARKLRRFGIDGTTFRNQIGDINPNSDIPEVGWAFTMNNLCAALGNAQLPTVNHRMRQTRSNVAVLLNKIKTKTLPALEFVPTFSDGKAAYWTLLVLVDNRDLIISGLKQHGVHSSSIHQRNDVYTGFRASASHILPNTTNLQGRVLGIPCGWWLSDADLETIASALEKVLSGTA